MRRFLVYVPTVRGQTAAELFGPDRLFDVALNDHTGEGVGTERAEHRFAVRSHKWPGIRACLDGIVQRYSAAAFIDDDIEVSTAVLDRLFLVGEALGLDLWQPALTPDSEISHGLTRAVPDLIGRATNFVEIQMPFFSRRALERCWPSFGENMSGWGLDFLWAKLLDYQGLAILDSLPVRHLRPNQSKTWKLSNGKTAGQEMAELMRKHGLSKRF